MPALSRRFILMAIVFNVCLIASNLFETKIFAAGPLTLTGGLLIFPISYIINDCMTEIWGYRSARFVIWTAFIMNLFVVGVAQIVRILPAAPFWDGQEHFDYIFAANLRITIASMLAFVFGSLANSLIMDRMHKASENDKGFGWRAIASTLGGESLDSVIFFPIAFWGVGVRNMLIMMITQIVLKTVYEIAILPITATVVRQLRKSEAETV